MQVTTEELNSFVGKVPVVVSPVELLGDVPAGLEGLHLSDDVEVGHVEFYVLGSKGVLLSNHHTLFEQV